MSPGLSELQSASSLNAGAEVERLTLCPATPSKISKPTAGTSNETVVVDPKFAPSKRNLRG